MAVVIPFALSSPLPVSITRVVSLYNATPPFQYEQDFVNNWGDLEPTPADQLIRNTTPSFGFPHTTDTSGPAVAGTGNYVPPNAYVVVAANQVYAESDIRATETNAILLIDMSVAPIEPGFTRLRVDYIYDNQPQIEYFDVPFYEGWDLNSTEIEAIVAYATEAFDFIQQELTNLEEEFNFLDSHMLLKGMSVSGSITATQATGNLTAPMQAHSIPMTNAMLQYPDQEQPQEELTPALQSKSDTISSYTTSVIYAGQSFYIDLGQTPVEGDTLAINGILIPTTINGTTLTGTAPAYIPYSVSLQVSVVNRNLTKASVTMQFSANPIITSILTTDGVAVGSPGDQFVISGVNFSTVPGSVTFTKSVSATVTSWSANQIIGLIPSGAQSGAVTVHTNSVSASSYFNLYYPNVNANFVVLPAISVLAAGETVSLTAQYNNQTVPVQWSITTGYRNIGSGSISYGTIDSSGNYTAPSLVSSAIPIGIVASYRSPYGPVVAEASIMVLPTSSTLTISPSGAVVAPLYTQRFTLDNNGTPITNFLDVEWFVNGISGGNDQVGTITTSGLYQAPVVLPTLKTITISAVYEGVSATSAVRVNASTAQESHSIGVKTSTTSVVSLPTVTEVGQGCPGTYVQITGTNWTTDANTIFYAVGIGKLKTQNAPVTTDNVNYAASILVPGFAGGGPYTIYVQTPNGLSSQVGSLNTNQLVIPVSCSTPTAAPFYGPSTMEELVYRAPEPTPDTGEMPKSSGCDQVTVSPSTATVIIPNGSQQFNCYISLDSGTPVIITPEHWLVNGIVGGNSTYGTITVNGLYTAPAIPPVYQQVQITALAVNGSEFLSGYGVVTFQSTQTQATNCNITVQSQLNIFFGDGRCGYVPVGTTFTIYPGQYLTAVYQETLDEFFAPIVSTTDIQLSLQAFNATDPNQADSLYNGTLTQYGNGKNIPFTYTRYQYIVLGVCDPQDGIFHEMWDILPFRYMLNQNIPAQAPCAHGMFLSESKKITVEDHAKKQLKGFKSSSIDISNHVARPLALWTGQVCYADETLTVVKPFTLLQFENTSKTYIESQHFYEQSIKIKSGEHLVALRTALGSFELHVLSQDDALFDSPNTYLLGTVVDNNFISTEAIQVIDHSKSINISVDKLPPSMKKIIQRMKDSKK